MLLLRKEKLTVRKLKSTRLSCNLFVSIRQIHKRYCYSETFFGVGPPNRAAHERLDGHCYNWTVKMCTQFVYKNYNNTGCNAKYIKRCSDNITGGAGYTEFTKSCVNLSQMILQEHIDTTQESIRRAFGVRGVKNKQVI